MRLRLYADPFLQSFFEAMGVAVLRVREQGGGVMGKDMWQEIVDHMPEEAQKRYLARILRSRKPWTAVEANGCHQIVPRFMVRDYLKEKHPDVKRHYK